ncbi:hypothetical protein HETIRDRAFT_118570 [Heterobasidion irregulare TC 32-1]|uniref:Uncharacterized protein n=1 Tax=Heterobasidion irregulare (strain TC 32-1) TaxID=747525 RepID=W4JUB4_HETIT|nr:uncharacterized protein HETIRDRAFT_118570 [Heterobasidion irregulare TC 32-1]ETW77142.1 hypothetical protein HETIRDRAFT_118570 [Heterobasidion irregulare TC 32-1]
MCIGVGIWTEKDNTRTSGETGREEREEKGQREQQRRKASKQAQRMRDFEKANGDNVHKKESVGTEVLALHSPASGRDILAVTHAQTHVLIQRSHLPIHSHLYQGFDIQDDVDEDGDAKWEETQTRREQTWWIKPSQENVDWKYTHDMFPPSIATTFLYRHYLTSACGPKAERNHKKKVKIEQRMEHQGQVQEVKDPARDSEARGTMDAYTRKKEEIEKDVKGRTHVDLAQEEVRTVKPVMAEDQRGGRRGGTPVLRIPSTVLQRYCSGGRGPWMQGKGRLPVWASQPKGHQDRQELGRREEDRKSASNRESRGGEGVTSAVVQLNGRVTYAGSENSSADRTGARWPWESLTLDLTNSGDQLCHGLASHLAKTQDSLLLDPVQGTRMRTPTAPTHATSAIEAQRMLRSIPSLQPRAFSPPYTHICSQISNSGTICVVACEAGDAVLSPAEDRLEECGQSICVDALEHDASDGL